MTKDLYQRARELDFDRTMAAAFARAPAALFALIAFQGELGAIRAKVTDPVTFEIRHLWWREAIAALEKGETRKHPVVEALAAAIRAGELESKTLIEMVEARFAEFSEEASDFETFIGLRKTFLTPFYRATLQTLKEEAGEGEFNTFLALDVLGCLRNLEFYRARGVFPFRGAIRDDLIKNLLQGTPKVQYFKKLKALGNWHFRRQKKLGFKPALNKQPESQPSKIIKLWLSNWG